MGMRSGDQKKDENDGQEGNDIAQENAGAGRSDAQPVNTNETHRPKHSKSIPSETKLDTEIKKILSSTATIEEKSELITLAYEKFNKQKKLQQLRNKFPSEIIKGSGRPTAKQKDRKKTCKKNSAKPVNDKCNIDSSTNMQDDPTISSENDTSEENEEEEEEEEEGEESGKDSEDQENAAESEEEEEGEDEEEEDDEARFETTDEDEGDNTIEADSSTDSNEDHQQSSDNSIRTPQKYSRNCLLAFFRIKKLFTKHRSTISQKHRSLLKKNSILLAKMFKMSPVRYDTYFIEIRDNLVTISLKPKSVPKFSIFLDKFLASISLPKTKLFQYTNLQKNSAKFYSRKEKKAIKMISKCMKLDHHTIPFHDVKQLCK